MAAATFERARKAFAKAGKDTAKRERIMVCGVRVNPRESCVAQGLYTETFRGRNYHFQGKCENGHELERYGYAETEVRD